MLIIGERINTSRETIATAVKNRDAALIQREAQQQVEAGADYLDVNCGTLLKEEAAYFAWLVDTVQEAVEVPLCLDSPNPEVIRAGLERHRHGVPLINSITNEPERMESLLPLAQEYGAKVVALCLGAGGSLPHSKEERVAEAQSLIATLTQGGLALEDLYVDPVVCPVSTDSMAGAAVLEALREIRIQYPGVHLICGLSNISFGLPQRRLLNQNFLVMCLAAGLDAALMDPLDQRLRSNILAAEVLLGRDEFAVNYVTAHRAGRLTL